MLKVKVMAAMLDVGFWSLWACEHSITFNYEQNLTKLGTNITLDHRKNPINFEVSMSKVKVMPAILDFGHSQACEHSSTFISLQILTFLGRNFTRSKIMVLILDFGQIGLVNTQASSFISRI